jgi:hypothetical protein
MKRTIVCCAFAVITHLTAAQNSTSGSTIITREKTQPAMAAPTDRTSVNIPPELIKNTFDADYPGKNTVTWKIEGSNWWVYYSNPETKSGHIIVYDKEGKVIRREDEAEKGFPERITAYYSEKFPGEKFKVWETEKPAGQRFYFVTRKDKNYWFDKNGKFVEKTRSRPGDELTQ